jgi:TrpR-related protein YerC/YecD
MNQKIHVPEVDQFLEAVLTLQTKDEGYAFFEDICTVNELLAIAQRYAVAKMLRQKKTYLDISEATGASTATISRVNRSLNFGNDGYDLTFSRLGIQQSAQDEEV